MPKKPSTQQSETSVDNEEVPEIKGPKKVAIQAFLMIRNADQTGISGTGIVGEGAVFANGKCVFCFESATPCVQVWDSFDAFMAVHVLPHEPFNQTEIRWVAGDSR